MIAAIFPVAISQSKLTLDETSGSAVARAKVTEFEQATADSFAPAIPATNWPVVFMPTNNPVTNIAMVRPIESFNGTRYPAWKQVRGLEVVRDDPRYACVMLYRRGGMPALTNPLPADWSDTAQIYAIIVTCRGTLRPTSSTGLTMNGAAVGTVPARVQPQFDKFDYGFDASTPNTAPNTVVPPVPPVNYTFSNPNNLVAHPIAVRTQNDGAGVGTGIDTILISTSKGLPQAVAEGAYVVISNDTNVTAPHVNVTGRIYRIGVRRTDLDTGGYTVYELQPGDDIQAVNNNQDLNADTAAYCVGRERLPDGSFIGGAQDVSIYTTFIPVKP